MTEQTFDAVIVGAGISGALIANELSEAGFSVLILEAGSQADNRQQYIDTYYAAEIKTPDAPYGIQDGSGGSKAQANPSAPHPGVPIDARWKDPNAYKTDPRYYFVQTGSVAFGSNYERIVGGTTQHWLGTCLRFMPQDFTTKTSFGFAVDWPIGYADLEPWYTEAESQLGVAGNVAADEAIGIEHTKPYPMEEVPVSYLDQYMGKKLNGKQVGGVTITVESTPQARNTVGYDNRPPCMGNTSCVPVCPIQAKYDATVHLNKATKMRLLGSGKSSVPAKLVTKAVVYKVDVDASTDQVTALHYKDWDGNDHKVSGKRYILAAHAIENPKVLMMSPWKNGKTVANSSGQVGKNLMDHICLVAWGKTADEPIYPFRGPLSTSGIPQYRGGATRKTRAAYRVEIGNEGWNWSAGAPQSNVMELVTPTGNVKPLFGTALRNQLNKECTHQVRIAMELEATPLQTSYIKPSETHMDRFGLPRPEVHYEIMGGAKDVTYAGTDGEYTVKGYVESNNVAQQLFEQADISWDTTVDASNSTPGVFIYNNTRYQYRGAGHVIGTHTMGADKSSSVVDSYQRSWDHSNLFIVGCGSFPTTGTANPTLTMAALALRTAKELCNDLSK